MTKKLFKNWLGVIFLVLGLTGGFLLFSNQAFATACTGDPQCGAGEICVNPNQGSNVIDGGTCQPVPTGCVPQTVAQVCSTDPNSYTYGHIIGDGCGGTVDCSGSSPGSGGGQCSQWPGAQDVLGHCYCPTGNPSNPYTSLPCYKFSCQGNTCTQDNANGIYTDPSCSNNCVAAACGGDGQACCAGNTCNNSSSSCTAGVCTPVYKYSCSGAQCVPDANGTFNDSTCNNSCGAGSAPICGTAAGHPSVSAPSSNLCPTGESLSVGVTASGGYWSWACSNATAYPAVTCYAAISCPTTGNNVTLSSTSITAGQTSTASAPSGWTGGTYSSSNSAVASVSGATVTGVAQGSTGIGGSGWNAPNGATGCFLSSSTITVAAGSCSAVAIQPGSSISPSTVVAGGAFSATCDYGFKSANFSFNPFPGCGSFSPTGATGYTWSCVAPATAGSVTIYCSSQADPTDNKCASGPTSIGTLQVTDFSVSASANPSTINGGSSSAIFVNVSPINGFNGSVTINAPAGVTPATLPISGGSGTATFTYTSAPTDSGTKSFTFTAVSSGLTHTATANVNVNAAAPTVNLVASPSSISYNGNSTLTWTVVNATSCVDNGTGMPSGNWSSGASGSASTGNLTTSKTYSLTCTGPGGVNTGSTTVGVGVGVVVVTLTGDSSSVNYNSPTILRWTVNNVGTACTASANMPSGNWSTGGSGSVSTGNLTANQTYTLNCTGPGATPGSATFSVTVLPPPAAVVNLSANPTSVTYNNPSTLTWTINNATACTASANMPSGNWSTGGSGSVSTGNLTANQTYTLNCTGLGAPGSGTVNIVVGLPPSSCGPASGPSQNFRTSTDVTTAGLCTVGTASAVTQSGNQWTWTCSGGTTASCSANVIVDASCGTANQSYPYSASSFGSDTFCNTGTLSGAAPTFPAAGSSANWTCNGINTGNSSGTCTAKTYSWQAGGFGVCSSTCGNGSSTQSVVCKRSDGTTVADSNCNPATKPATSQFCTDYSTCSYSWQASGWGTCSATCGGGTQTQTAVCKRADGTTVPDAFCDPATKPALSQACNTQACPTITCSTDSQCNDNNSCTTDTCLNPGTPSSSCSHATTGTHLSCSGTSCAATANTAASCTNSCTNDQSCGACAANSGQACSTGNVCITGQVYQCDGTCGGGTNNPVNGGWSSWSACSSSCGNGSDSRSCTNPAPSCSGTSCTGSTTGFCTDYSTCGYSWVTSGWGTCSATCGGGTQTQTVTCQRSDGTTVPDAFCDPATKPALSQACNTQACPTITCSSDAQCNDNNSCTTDTCLNPGTPSSSCSHNAVTGTHLACSGTSCSSTANTSGSCTDSCVNNQSCGGCAPNSGQACSTGNVCVSGQTYQCDGTCGGGTNNPVNGGWSSWSACSSSCGNGTDSRSCSNPAPSCNGTTCSGSTTGFCTDYSSCTYGWVQGGYGACSATCGGGTQTQTVTCQRSDGTPMPDAFCDPATKPAVSKSCNTQTCVSYSWVASGFTACSTACGVGGTQTQTVVCQRNDGVTVADTNCNAATKPATSQSCSDFSGCSYTWQASGFTACSATCGNGSQTQTVVCKRSDGTTVADSYCNSATKPATNQFCTDYSSCSYGWTQGGFGACSATCGGGTQTQTVTCQRSDFTNVPEVFCDPATKPASSKACNTQACGGSVCNSSLVTLSKYSVSPGESVTASVPPQLSGGHFVISYSAPAGAATNNGGNGSNITAVSNGTVTVSAVGWTDGVSSCNVGDASLSIGSGGGGSGGGPGIPNAPTSLSLSSPSCGSMTATWPASTSGTVLSYILYRNTINSMSGAIARSIAGTTNTDTGLTPGFYYYWVSTLGIGGESLPPTPAAGNSTGGTNVPTCNANLSSSDKDIIAVNSQTFTSNQCGGTDPLPPGTGLKIGDHLTFQINLCNDTGQSAASNISVSENLTNLMQRSDTHNWNVCYAGTGSNCAGGTVLTPGTGINQYTITGASPNQVLNMNLSPAANNIPASQRRTITFDAQLTVPSGYNGQTARFKNCFNISYNNSQTQTSASSCTPLLPFYTSSGVPTILEVP